MKNKSPWVNMALSLGLLTVGTLASKAEEATGTKTNASNAEECPVSYQTTLAPAVPWDKGRPVINGPDIYGASPGKDFIFLVPTVGERPLRFFAENLPPGLVIEPESGIIKGRAEKTGDYSVLLTAENKQGLCKKISRW